MVNGIARLIKVVLDAGDSRVYSLKVVPAVVLLDSRAVIAIPIANFKSRWYLSLSRKGGLFCIGAVTKTLNQLKENFKCFICSYAFQGLGGLLCNVPSMCSGQGQMLESLAQVVSDLQNPLTKF